MERCDNVRKDKKLGVGYEAPEGFTKYVFGDTVDELIDGLALLKDGRFINKFVCRFPDLSEEQFRRLDVVMPQTDNANEISKYACGRKKVCNTAEFEDALIRLNARYDIKDFARDVEGANIEKLEDAVVETKEASLIRYFAKEVKGANLLKLKKAIFEVAQGRYTVSDLAHFCEDHQDKQGIIEQEDIEKAEIISILLKNANAIRILATEVKGANVEKLQEAIIKTEDAEQIFLFASDADGADIEMLRKAILKTKNYSYISFFENRFGTGKKPNIFGKIKERFF